MREPPPPYEGEGPFALWHYSEDPSPRRFEPRPPADPATPAVVWAVDTRLIDPAYRWLTILALVL